MSSSTWKSGIAGLAFLALFAVLRFFTAEIPANHDGSSRTVQPAGEQGTITDNKRSGTVPSPDQLSLSFKDDYGSGSVVVSGSQKDERGACERPPF